MATEGGGGSRVRSYRERENNKRRERRRRAITAKIYAGLRTYGNYTIPRHCDTNEVLKALCDQAGWTVEPDGTTYPKGRPVEHMEAVGRSAPVSPFSSYYNLSPYASYHPSPGSSSLHSPASSSYGANAYVDGNSLIPWLNKLSASSSASSSSSQLQHLYKQTGSISAPVISPLISTSHTPRVATETRWNTLQNSLLPPSNHACQNFPNAEWVKSRQFPDSSPGSPTLSLISSNPCDLKEVTKAGGGSNMWTPGQSGTGSPPLPASIDEQNADHVSMIDEFAFRSSTKKQMNPWEGERLIHEEFVSDDLKLTLGTPGSRYYNKTD